MTTPPSPQRITLGRELRALREAAGLSNATLAERLGISTSRLSRVELAKLLPRRPEVEAWLEATGATSAQQERLLAAVDEIRTEAVAFRDTNRGGRAARQLEIGDVERKAGRIRQYHLGLLSGLLQTPDYAHAMFEVDNILQLDDAGDAVAARVQRQQVLYESDRRLEFVLGEPALWWRPGSATTQIGQLDRLLVVAGLPTVDLRVIPLGTPTPVAFHSFEIYDRRADAEPPLVYLEHSTGEIHLSDARDVRVYEQRFAALQELAVGGGDLRELVGRVMERLRERE